MNKDTQQVLREVKRQGARIETRKRGSGVLVHGPNGSYIVHLSVSAGTTTAVLRKNLRRIGFRV